MEFYRAIYSKVNIYGVLVLVNSFTTPSGLVQTFEFLWELNLYLCPAEWLL